MNDYGPGCNCEVRAFMVGGGGDHDYTGCGAGSGYHNYTSWGMWTLTRSIARIAVGNYGQASNFTRYGETYTALPGQDATYDYHADKQHGGNGYSGGGGFCDKYNDCSGNSFNGGANGSDGEGSSSDGTFGHGSGEDLSQYKLANSQLSPGEGGQAWLQPVVPLNPTSVEEVGAGYS